MLVILTPRKAACRCENNLDNSETLSEEREEDHGYATSRLYSHNGENLTSFLLCSIFEGFLFLLYMQMGNYEVLQLSPSKDKVNFISSNRLCSSAISSLSETNEHLKGLSHCNSLDSFLNYLIFYLNYCNSASEFHTESTLIEFPYCKKKKTFVLIFKQK